MKSLIYYSLTHDKYKSTKMHSYCFLQSKFHNSCSLWQIDQTRNKIIQSCQSTMILVLDSLILILNFVNWIKARFIEKLGFPDRKSVPWEREGCWVEFPHARVLTSSCCWPIHWMVRTNCEGIKIPTTKYNVWGWKKYTKSNYYKYFNLLLELIDIYG